MTPTNRQPDCRPGSITDTRHLAERLRASRERLAASDLAGQARAWRLWSACVAQTFDMGRAADTIYVTELARLSGIDRTAAGRLLLRFHELDIFGWDPAPRGSHGISRLYLHAASAPHEQHGHAASAPHVASQTGPTCGVSAALQSNVLLSVGVGVEVGRNEAQEEEGQGGDWHAHEDGPPEEQGPPAATGTGTTGLAHLTDEALLRLSWRRQDDEGLQRRVAAECKSRGLR